MEDNSKAKRFDKRYESGAGSSEAQSSSEPGVSTSGFAGSGAGEDRRFKIDCAVAGRESGCTLVLIGTEEEVISAGVLHATKVHGMKDEPSLRDDLRSLMREEGEESSDSRDERFKGRSSGLNA